ncbi:MAG: hypothetical protein PQJ59_10215 [Spirochaetales bacterium]|nr:hypothetical protein [Spirochaetales bacterium]
MKFKLICLGLVLLFLGGCRNMYLTSPYYFEGDIELYLDGELVAAADLDSGMADDMSNYGFYIDSGDNPVNGLAEFIIFQREMEVWEFWYLYENFGYYPSDSDSMSGYYKFEGSLACDSIVYYDSTDGGDNDGELLSGDTPDYTSFEVDGSTYYYMSPMANSRIALGDYVLPDKIEEFSVSFWFQESLDNSDDVNLFRIADLDDSDKTEIDLTIEEDGRFVLTIGTNWQKVWFKPTDYDDDSEHMLTFIFCNR